jgi:transposase InsO family protein
VFGPPEQLLTDLGSNFGSDVVAEMCRLNRTRKSFTSANHPQTNGFIERYNKTLSTELRRHLLDEEDWNLSLSMAVFRYKCDATRGHWNDTVQGGVGIGSFRVRLRGAEALKNLTRSPKILRIASRKSTLSC